MILWEHQIQAIEFARENTIHRTGRSLICMPPGAGKSEVAIATVIEWLSLSLANRAVVCVPSTRLLAQFYARLARLTREPIAFEQGSRRAPSNSRLVLASQLSLAGRMCRYANNTLIVIDEAHHSSYAAPIFSSVISRFPRAIGLTATPWTNRLINLFDQTYFYSLTEAISNCVVSPIEIIRMPTFAPGCNSPAIIFVATNDEAKLKSEKHVHADWIGHSRDVSTNFAVLNCWKSGQIRTLFVNRMLLEGYDLPDLETVWIDMKIKSHVMCAQIIGRALRYRQGKRARIFVLSDESESTAREALAMMDQQP